MVISYVSKLGKVVILEFAPFIPVAILGSEIRCVTSVFITQIFYVNFNGPVPGFNIVNFPCFNSKVVNSTREREWDQWCFCQSCGNLVSAGKYDLNLWLHRDHVFESVLLVQYLFYYFDWCVCPIRYSVHLSAQNYNCLISLVFQKSVKYMYLFNLVWWNVNIPYNWIRRTGLQSSVLDRK